MSSDSKTKGPVLTPAQYRAAEERLRDHFLRVCRAEARHLRNGRRWDAGVAHLMRNGLTAALMELETCRADVEGGYASWIDENLEDKREQYETKRRKE